MIPPIEAFSGRIESVASEYVPGATYTLSLEELTCTCPDQQARQTRHPPREVRVLCKHLRRALLKECLASLDDILRCLVAEKELCDCLIVRHLPDSGLIIIFGYARESEWLDVYAARRLRGDLPGFATGPYERHSFHLWQKRWSYGRSPYPAAIVRRLIDEEFGRWV